MRIAVPILGDDFCEHFGRSDGFFLCDVEAGSPQPGRMRRVVRPKTRIKCESLPQWLKRMGVTAILAGGIGPVAQRRLAELGIEVSTGHRGKGPEQLVSVHLAGGMGSEKNPCAGFEHRHRHCRG